MSALEIVGAVTLVEIGALILFGVWLGCLIIKDLRREDSE